MKNFCPERRAWILLLSAVPVLCYAHTGQGDVGGGFLAGFTHPIFGIDHVIAMVAVGLWGAQLGAPAIWLLPVTFPIVMACGGVLGAAGIHIPGVELGIAASALTLGAMVAFAVRPPLWHLERHAAAGVRERPCPRQHRGRR